MRIVGWGRCAGGSPGGGDGGAMFSSSGSINILLDTWSCPYEFVSSPLMPFFAALFIFLRCRLSKRFLIARLLRSRNGSGVVSSLSDADVPSPGRTPSEKSTVFGVSSPTSPLRRQLLPSGALGLYTALTNTESTSLTVASSSSWGASSEPATPDSSASAA